MKSMSSRGNKKGLPQQGQKSLSRIAIDDRFYFKSLKGKHNFYNFYKGVDILKAKWVHIYVKHIQSDNSYPLSKGTKQHLRNQFCPKVVWAGDVFIEQNSFYVEVHEKYGPSLQNVFDLIRRGPTEKQLLHLLLELIKLIQRMYSLRLVSGELDPHSIVFDPNPKKNQLYLLNSFSVKKRNAETKPAFTKYCSRGAHLGRNLGVKDDLQSACYILIDLFTDGHFLQNKKSSQYQEEKLSLKIQEFAEGLPKTFIDFYNYVINLNCNDQVHFFNWKTHLSRLLTNDIINQPYGFLLVQNDGDRHLTSYTKPSIPSEDEVIFDMMEISDKDEQQKEKNIQKVNREMKNLINIKNTFIWQQRIA